MPVFIILISILIAIANGWHVITQWITNPPDRYFTWIAHYYADYFLYVSQIAQGVRGNWIWSKSMYTNEVIPDTWVYWPNVLIGKIGSIFISSPFLIYSVSLTLLVSVLLWLLWKIAREVFPKRPMTRLIAFLFLTTASNFPNFRALLTQGTFTLLGDTWFSPTPALNRLGGVPHQTLQTILILSVILVYTKLIEHRPQWSNSPLSSLLSPLLFFILSFLTATLSPIQMLLVVVACAIVTLRFRRYKEFLFLAIPALLGAYLVNQAFDSSPLYAVAKQWEAAQTVAITVPAFLLAMGPIILFVPFGIRPFLASLTPFKLVLFVYGLASLVIFFTPIPKLLVTSPTRWIHPAAYVLFPLLAAEGMISVVTMLSRVVSRIMPAPLRGARPGNHEYGITEPHIFSFALLLITILYSVFTIPAIIAQVSARSTREASPILYGDLNHVPKNDIDALFALNKLPDTGVVITDPALPYDIVVPIIAGKISFTGHPVHTLYPETKEQLRQKFFSGTMTHAEAKQFLNDHRIGYIIVAPTHQNLTHEYQGLTKSFQNGDITIFAVQL